jgi:hypothetical protein
MALFMTVLVNERFQVALCDPHVSPKPIRPQLPARNPSVNRTGRDIENLRYVANCKEFELVA